MHIESSYNYVIVALSILIAILVSVISSFIVFVITISKAMNQYKMLEKMAYEDPITGLPNRNQMDRFFDTYVGNESIGVLFLDLDRFKVINDTLGHHIGDLLVREVGNRLRQFIYSNQQVFRIGGDEFLIIAKNCGQACAERLAQEILQQIQKTYNIEGNELNVTGSVGISTGSIQNVDRSILLEHADAAMYHAKGLGKNQYYVHNEQMGIRDVRTMELEKKLACSEIV